MAYLIHGTRHPVIYCANPRTGSTAMAMTLQNMGCECISKHHCEPPVDKIPNDCLIVESVRHHCDVFVSWWFWRNSSMAFPKYVRKIMQGEHGFLKANRLYDRFPMTNYILRYETLEFEWQTLCSVAGIEYRPLLRSKNTKRPKNIKWDLLFDYGLRREVYGMYGEEMERLGYGID